MSPMSPKAPHGTALYVPFIEFQSETWLKRSLLYWDHIRRIVPRSHSPSDSDDVIELVKAKAVVNTDPGSYIHAAGERYANAWGPAVEKLLRGRVKGLSKSDLKTDDWIAFHGEKLQPEFLIRLRELGLADGGDEREFYKIDPRVGHGYMHALAATMSESMGTPLVADSSDLARSTERFTFARKIDPRTEDSIDESWSLICDLGIAAPTPARLAELSVDRLLRFRDRHQDVRHAFRGQIEAVQSDLASITDANAIADVMEGHRDAIAHARKEYCARRRHPRSRGSIRW